MRPAKLSIKPFLKSKLPSRGFKEGVWESEMIHNVIGDYCDWTLDIVNGTLEERKSNHRQAVGCYQTGNVSGPVGKLGRGLVAASDIQTNAFTFLASRIENKYFPFLIF